jgi:hypothetical protein
MRYDLLVSEPRMYRIWLRAKHSAEALFWPYLPMSAAMNIMLPVLRRVPQSL